MIFNEPVVGKKPEFVISTYTTVPEGVFKGNMGLYWQVGSDYNMSDAREMKEDDVFEPGKYYTAQLYDGDNFEISQGYFRNNECIKINGVIGNNPCIFSAVVTCLESIDALIFYEPVTIPAFFQLLLPVYLLLML